MTIWCWVWSWVVVGIPYFLVEVSFGISGVAAKTVVSALGIIADESVIAVSTWFTNVED